MFCGRLKTPEPTMEPITSAVSEPRRSFLPDAIGTGVADVEISVAAMGNLPKFWIISRRGCIGSLRTALMRVNWSKGFHWRSRLRIMQWRSGEVLARPVLSRIDGFLCRFDPHQ